MKKNIHILATDQPSSLGYHFDKVSSLNSVDYAPNFGFDEFNTKNNYQHRPYHLYITCDEDINENDYIVTKDGRLVQVSYLLSKDLQGASKVILTTDADLIADGVQAIDDEFLEWFVKNSSCESVGVNKKRHFEVDKSKRVNPLNGVYYLYKIIIPQEQPKQGSIKFVVDSLKRSDPEAFAKLEKALLKNEQDLMWGKQETLEEAALKYKNLKLPDDLYDAFISGANYQAERMYSEEEVVELLNFVSKEYNISNGIGWFHTHESNEDISSKEVLDKFKKK